MPTFPFMQVDAFTEQPLGGNPCAIILDADALDENEMQAIAIEMNLAETSFVLKSEIADYRARYFTPAAEIPLAGHPTIATIIALIDAGRLALTGDHTHLTLELQVGPIPIEIEANQGIVKRVIMSQRKPEFFASYAPEAVLPTLGLAPDDALPGTPIQTVSTGTPMLMVPLRNLDALRRAQMDISAYDAFQATGDFFSTHLFCLQGITEAARTFARHLDMPPDLLEDPFTGSATGSMAAYLWRYGLLDEPTFIAEQGHWMQRPGQATVEVIGSRDDIQTVKVGGNGVTVLRGELLI